MIENHAQSLCINVGALDCGKKKIKDSETITRHTQNDYEIQSHVDGISWKARTQKLALRLTLRMYSLFSVRSGLETFG